MFEILFWLGFNQIMGRWIITEESCSLDTVSMSLNTVLLYPLCWQIWLVKADRNAGEETNYVSEMWGRINKLATL